MRYKLRRKEKWFRTNFALLAEQARPLKKREDTKLEKAWLFCGSCGAKLAARDGSCPNRCQCTCTNKHRPCLVHWRCSCSEDPLDLFVNGQWTEIGTVDLMFSEDIRFAEAAVNDDGIHLRARVFWRCLELSNVRANEIENSLNDNEPVYCRIRHLQNLGADMMHIQIRVTEFYRTLAEADGAGLQPDLPPMDYRWIIVGPLAHIDASQ